MHTYRHRPLKDRLAKYLRARMPEIAEIHVVLRDGVDIF